MADETNVSDSERVGKIQERLTKDLASAPEFQGETPEVKKKRAGVERSLTIFDRVKYRLDKGAKAVPEVLQELSSEAKYLAEHARDEIKRQEYEAEAKLAAEWGKLYGQKKQVAVTEPVPAKAENVTVKTANSTTGASAQGAVATATTTEQTPVSAPAVAQVNASTAEAPKMDIAAQIEAALKEEPGGNVIPQGPIVSTEPAAAPVAPTASVGQNLGVAPAPEAPVLTAAPVAPVATN